MTDSFSITRGFPLFISNVWLLKSQGITLLIDTSHAAARRPLLRWLNRNGIARPGDLSAIVLTHRHSDHAGNSAFLRERLHCPVCLHENDAPFLDGRMPPPPLSRGLGGPWDKACCALEDRLPAKSPVDRTFTAAEPPFDLEVVETFGHTQGSVMLYHRPSQTLFSGDSLLTAMPPLMMRERFCLAVAAYSNDQHACHQATLAFLADPPPITRICPGHGPLVDRDARNKLIRFASA